MKEISPSGIEKMSKHKKILNKTKKEFRKRIKEIAKGGCANAEFSVGHYTYEDEIVDWLRSLGFRVTKGTDKYYIYWN